MLTVCDGMSRRVKACHSTSQHGSREFGLFLWVGTWGCKAGKVAAAGPQAVQGIEVQWFAEACSVGGWGMFGVLGAALQVCGLRRGGEGW